MIKEIIPSQKLSEKSNCIIVSRLSLFPVLCLHPSAMEVCPPNRSFSCRDPSWAERRENQRYATSHSSRCFSWLMWILLSPAGRISEGNIALCHLRFHRCFWFRVDKYAQRRTNVNEPFRNSSVSDKCVIWERAGVVTISWRPLIVVITFQSDLCPQRRECMLIFSVT